MNSETPFEGNVPDDGDEPPYQWLDEWLCEYVDGTMDPSLEAIFEQYVEANPELKAHVERLQETRDLLSAFGRPDEPASEVEAEVCRKVGRDVLSSPAPASTAPDRNRPLTALSLVSSVAVALVVGFLVGTTVVDPSPKDAPSTAAVESDARSLPSLQPSQAPLVEPFDRSRYQSLRSSPPSDSARRQSPLTTIGIP